MSDEESSADPDWEDGWNAAADGKQRDANPYDDDMSSEAVSAEMWDAGWRGYHHHQNLLARRFAGD